MDNEAAAEISQNGIWAMTEAMEEKVVFIF